MGILTPQESANTENQGTVSHPAPNLIPGSSLREKLPTMQRSYLLLPFLDLVATPFEAGQSLHRTPKGGNSHAPSCLQQGDHAPASGHPSGSCQFLCRLKGPEDGQRSSRIVYPTNVVHSTNVVYPTNAPSPHLFDLWGQDPANLDFQHLPALPCLIWLKTLHR